MKVGDLVQYAAEGVEEDVGMIVAVRPSAQIPHKTLVDILWDNGIWTDDAEVFKVIS